MNKILLIDDDPEMGELLSTYLDGEGYTLHHACTAKDGLKVIEHGDFELVLLDIVLPDISGLNVLGKIRQDSTIPVIMLTGKGDEVDRVVGLEMGADDYICKPFPLRELLARMRASLRRCSMSKSSIIHTPSSKGKLKVGGIEVNLDSQSIIVQGLETHFTAAEFSIIEHLAVNCGKLVERDELMEIALGRTVDFDDYVLNVHMSNLRRKIGDSVAIKTIRGRGYMMTARNKTEA
ncbi:response regulator transcription factor [Maridesulfovibrio zosterae]|uniref:response regulator transcription factor n=1 Tax=Maridesulfovibrio zosterae TaxID=82171 RepID=UPI0003FA2923|nr:response regulator transcription factor [Maridesulfovibrio zosterae]